MPRLAWEWKLKTDRDFYAIFQFDKTTNGQLEWLSIIDKLKILNQGQKCRDEAEPAYSHGKARAFVNKVVGQTCREFKAGYMLRLSWEWTKTKYDASFNLTRPPMANLNGFQLLPN